MSKHRWLGGGSSGEYGGRGGDQGRSGTICEGILS
ncbi:unnamed protein product [Linum tenue]|uniref:Uncharacterized protein n=1 Tax=Linum tenue TaxID=586396 RepID=A0AAV0NYZ1_9ROSI|nr:unnamed protein product [Linum tenue]